MLGMSITGVKLRLRRFRGATRSDRTGKRKLAAAEGALEHDLAAEAVELGRTTARPGGDRAGLFDQALLVDQPAEVLLVQASSGQRFDCALELQQGERLGHQLEDDRPVLDLGAQASDASSEN